MICQHSSAKKPHCKAHALKGSDYCAAHQVAQGSSLGVDLGADPPPFAPPSGRATGIPETPKIGAERLIQGQQQRREERQATVAMPDTGQHVYEPEVIGARVAVLMHAAEMRSRQAFRERGQPRRSSDPRFEGMRLDDGDPEEPRRPLRVLTRRTRPDPTRIIDPVTKMPPASLRPDYVQRWVATVDWNDRPTEHRIAEYEDYGYEFVTDSEGRPIESRYGVAMQGPAENYAARMLDRTPTGAFQRDDSLQHADAIANIINRKQGDEVVRVVAERDHGVRYSEVPLGQEHVHDV